MREREKNFRFKSDTLHLQKYFPFSYMLARQNNLMTDDNQYMLHVYLFLLTYFNNKDLKALIWVRYLFRAWALKMLSDI